MKYSFIFCYRDRERHLKITLPRLRSYLESKSISSYEIIISEQIDNKKLRRGALRNEGAKVATGDILIFHDIDYFPVDVEYWDGASDVYLPIHKVEFVKYDLSLLEELNVPSGYRHFKNYVDDDFFGGVSVFKRDVFFNVNGFSPSFIGWGFEDSDLRNRVLLHGYNVTRSSTGHFFAIEHPDSHPPMDDPDFLNNIRLCSNSKKYLKDGLENQISKSSIITSPSEYVDIWVQSSDFGINRLSDNIVSSKIPLIDMSSTNTV